MFTLILGKLRELVLSKAAWESFSSKVVDRTADVALNYAKNIKDYEPILKTLQKNLESLSAKACDVEEAVKNAERSGRKKRKREVEEWLGEVKSFEEEVEKLGNQVESEGFIMRLMDGGKAAKLNDEIDKLVEQSRNFGELVLDVCGTNEETLFTNGLIGEAFNKNLETILRRLETRDVLCIGVHGMGGVGKTTLAKHIHNRLVQLSQGHVFWVTVSQQFSIKSLQDKIARCIGVELLDEDEEDKRAGRLRRALSEMKNSVLILDDVWDKIDMSKVGCPVSTDCCRLIITTRSKEACRQIGCKVVISVEKLCEDEAWKLFNETLGNEIKLSPPIEKIAKSVAKLCGGLPLGITTVGGSMRGETDIHTWRNTFVELKKRVVGEDGMGGDEVYKVLKYSFDRLNGNHQSQSNEFNMFQHCFLYCSLYPEDHEINREDLVRMFISGGLLDERRSRREQVDQGHFVLKKLVDVCLLESCVDFEGRNCVTMHDLVRGMALKIGEGKYMVRAGDYYSLNEIPDEQEWTEVLEKGSLMYNGIRRIGDGISPNCPNLSTLLLRGNYPLKVIPESFFSKMQGLCTLDLGWTDIRKLPDSICDMKSLRALLLERCEYLEYVPYLGKLKALRELNLFKTAIKEVPQGLEELLHLKFLSMDTDGLKMLPSGLLLKLSHLQHLSLPFDIQIEGIENLKWLEEFHGRVKNVKDFNCFIGSGERRVHDRLYAIIVGPDGDTFDTRDGRFEQNDEESCFGTPYKRMLGLSECNLKDERALGQDTEYLAISKCEGLSMCFVDDFLITSLRKLVIKGCGGIKCILRSEQGIGLPLEVIELEKLEDWAGVIEKGEIGAASAAPTQPHIFASLKSLSMSNCNKMKKVGLPVLGVPNLENLTISNCGEIEEIFEDEGRGSVATFLELKRLWLKELPRLRKVGLPVSVVPNLEEIIVEKCGEIEEIFEDEGRGSVATIPELKMLWLKELPRLRKVELPVSVVPNLEEITIEKCGEIEKIFEDEGRGSVATLPKLKRLRLKELPKLRKVGLLVSVVPNLEEITIEKCGEIEEIFEDEGRDSVATLPKLKRLRLKELPKLRKVGLPVSVVPNLEEIIVEKCGEIEEIFEDEGRGSVATLPKLKRLRLKELPRLRKVGLPVSIVPNLEEITIEKCGEIEEIFEDEGRGSVATLPQLKMLWLKELPRLRKVELSVSVVPNLEEITIEKCGEIEEIFEDEGRGSVTTLPKLKRLRLKELPKLRKVGLPVLVVPNLEEIIVEKCGEIEEIFEDEGRGSVTTLPKLKWLRLKELPRLRKVGLPVSIVPNLEEITIEKCGEIEEIFEDEGRGSVATLPQLKMLWLKELPRLRKVELPVSVVPNLEEIIVEKCGEIEEIFEDEGRGSVATLPKLKRLRLKELPKLRKVGLPVSVVPNLEEIIVEKCGEIEEIFEDEGRGSVATLPQLKMLWLKELPRLRKVELPVSVVPNLEEITIEKCGEIEEIFEDEGRGSVATLPKLKRLRLKELPKLRKVGLPVSVVPNLEEIIVEKCGEIEEIFEDEGRGSVATLPQLKMLWLKELPRLRKVELPVSVVPNLEEITIEKCGEIEEIFEDEGRGSVATLPKLKRLRLKELPKLRKVGLPVSVVPNLEEIIVEKCGEIEEIFEDEGRGSVATLPQLKMLWLKELPRLRKVELPVSVVPNLEEITIEKCGEIEEIFEDEGRGSVATLRILKELQLKELPRLKSVCKATMICNSLEIIQIYGCPRLMKKLPVYVDVLPPPTLRRIDVQREWWESLEWEENHNLPQLLQPFLNLLD